MRRASVNHPVRASSLHTSKSSRLLAQGVRASFRSSRLRPSLHHGRRDRVGRLVLRGSERNRTLALTCFVVLAIGHAAETRILRVPQDRFGGAHLGIVAAARPVVLAEREDLVLRRGSVNVWPHRFHVAVQILPSQTPRPGSRSRASHGSGSRACPGKPRASYQYGCRSMATGCQSCSLRPSVRVKRIPSSHSTSRMSGRSRSPR